MPGLIFARLLFAAGAGEGKSCLFVLPDSDIINPSIRCNSPPVVTLFALPKVWFNLNIALSCVFFAFSVPVLPEPTIICAVFIGVW
jgi:hypothetical protein